MAQNTKIKAVGNMVTRMIIITTLVFGLFSFVSPRTVSAEDPGCYEDIGPGGNGPYAPTDCPTEGAARAVSQFDACFVVNTRVGLEERNCDNLGNPGSAVPSSGSTTGPPPTERGSAPDPDCDVGPGEDLTRENCQIIDYIVIAINFLSAIAVMVIIASIMIAGYQYTTARDNSGQIQQARERIVWALVALLIFIFMYAFLNFVVPGGVL